MENISFVASKNKRRVLCIKVQCRWLSVHNQPGIVGPARAPLSGPHLRALPIQHSAAAANLTQLNEILSIISITDARFDV